MKEATADYIPKLLTVSSCSVHQSLHRASIGRLLEYSIPMVPPESRVDCLQSLVLIWKIVVWLIH